MSKSVCKFSHAHKEKKRNTKLRRRVVSITANEDLKNNLKIEGKEIRITNNFHLLFINKKVGT